MPTYKITVAPTSEPVTVAQAKQWTKQEGDDDNDLMAGLIVAARDLCETYTGRAFITQTWEMVMDAFPGYIDPHGGASLATRTLSSGAWFLLGMRWGFALPASPVQSVVSVAYQDGAGNPQTLTAGVDYNVDIVSSPARVMPVFSRFWPLTQYAPNAVTVTFVCGYGAATDVPQSIRTAILMLVSYWYNNRDAYSVGMGQVVEMPMAVKSLLSQYRVFA